MIWIFYSKTTEKITFIPFLLYIQKSLLALVFWTLLQKTGIVYHLRRVKVSHPRRTKVSIVGRMNVSH